MDNSRSQKQRAIKTPLVNSTTSNPRNFEKTVKEAQRTFIKDKSYKPNVESTILERKIKASRITKDIFPSVREWAPRLWENKKDIFNNILSGTIMAMLSIPTSMAYALMVDLPVEVGIYSSIFGMIVYSFFGTSRQLIVGSTSTSFLIISQILAQYDQSEKLAIGAMITAVVGVFYLIMGLLKLGFIENAYSIPTLQGYLVAASMFTAVQQFKKIFHLKFSSSWFFIQVYELIASIPDWKPPVLIFSLISFIFLAIFKYLKIKKYHHSKLLNLAPIFVVIVSAFIVYMADLSKKYPSIMMPDSVPSSMPGLVFPLKFSSDFAGIMFGGIKFGIVVFTEGLIITKSIAAEKNYNINATYELTSLGLGNIFGCFFGAFPASGSIVRSPINNSLGANSQLSGLISGICIIIFVLGLSSLIKLIPTAVIYCIVLLTVLINILDLGKLPYLWKHFRKDFVMFVSSLLLCLLIDLADGVLLCLIISIVWLLRRSSKPTWNLKSFKEDEEDDVEDYTGRNPSGRSRKDEESRRKTYLENVLGLDTANQQKVNVARYDRRKTLMKYEEEEAANHDNLEVSQEIMSKRHSAFTSLDLNIYDLCLCHDPACPRRCHVLVITLYGHLSYFNANMLKEQADFISKMKSSRKSKETGEYSVKGLIYEIHQLRDIDYTAAITLKEIIKNIQGHDSNSLFIKFARMKPEMKTTLEATGFDEANMQHCEMDTLAVLFKLFSEIKHHEKERMELEYQKQLEEYHKERENKDEIHYKTSVEIITLDDEIEVNDPKKENANGDSSKIERSTKVEKSQSQSEDSKTEE